MHSGARAAGRSSGRDDRYTATGIRLLPCGGVFVTHFLNHSLCCNILLTFGDQSSVRYRQACPAARRW
jgi:hypothetical protein